MVSVLYCELHARIKATRCLEKPPIFGGRTLPFKLEATGGTHLIRFSEDQGVGPTSDRVEVKKSMSSERFMFVAVTLVDVDCLFLR